MKMADDDKGVYVVNISWHVYVHTVRMFETACNIINWILSMLYYRAMYVVPSSLTIAK